MKIRFELAGIPSAKSLVGRVRDYPAAAQRAGVAAANDTARTIITQSSRDITQRYNLPASYVKDQFTFYPAGKSDTAMISVRKRGVRLARFASKQLTAVAKGAKGDQLRGVPAGRKASGISVKELRAGGRKKMPGAFFLPLRAGKIDGGNGMGVFIRYGKLIEHTYGMAPFQAFKAWVRDRNPDLQAMLVSNWRARMRLEAQKK